MKVRRSLKVPSSKGVSAVERERGRWEIISLGSRQGLT